MELVYPINNCISSIHYSIRPSKLTDIDIWYWRTSTLLNSCDSTETVVSIWYFSKSFICYFCMHIQDEIWPISFFVWCQYSHGIILTLSVIRVVNPLGRNGITSCHIWAALLHVLRWTQWKLSMWATTNFMVNENKRETFTCNQKDIS